MVDSKEAGIIFWLSTVSTLLHIARHSFSFYESTRMVRDAKKRLRSVFTPRQLVNVGIFSTVQELRDAGFTTVRLKEDKFTAEELKGAYSAQEMKDAGYTAIEFKDSGFAARALADAGLFSVDELGAAGYSEAEVAEAAEEFSKQCYEASEKGEMGKLEAAIAAGAEVDWHNPNFVSELSELE